MSSVPTFSILPKHVAVIMDGNGRWAKKRFFPRNAGHRAGAKAVRELVENCVAIGISVLTLFAFSSENWLRPVEEVENLMGLFLSYLDNERDLFLDHHIRVRIIGDKSRLSKQLQEKISQTEALTATHQGMHLVIATSYGGRWDIIQATQQIAQKILEGELLPSEITEDKFTKHLCTSDLPEPDLFIRTSGEKRISNFLLWQLAYTELYFTDTLWPDFAKEHFYQALSFYQSRQRRFGIADEN